MKSDKDIDVSSVEGKAGLDNGVKITSTTLESHFSGPLPSP